MQPRASRIRPKRARDPISFPRSEEALVSSLEHRSAVPVPLELRLPRVLEPQIGFPNYNREFTVAFSTEENECGTYVLLSRALPRDWSLKGKPRTPCFSPLASYRALTLPFQLCSTYTRPSAPEITSVTLREFSHEKSDVGTPRLRASGRALDDFANLLGTHKAKHAVRFLAHDAHRYIGTLLDSIGVPVLRRDGKKYVAEGGVPYAPWLYPDRGDEVASHVAQQQLCSVISNAPRLSLDTIARYADELNNAHYHAREQRSRVA